MIEDSFSEFGLWWDAKEPENKISGIFTYNQENGLELRLIGTKLPGNGNQVIYMIHGHVFGKSNKPKEFTLFNCVLLNGGENYNYQPKILKYTYQIGFYLNFHFPFPLTTAKFSRIKCNSAQLNYWLAESISPLRVENSIVIGANLNLILQENAPMLLIKSQGRNNHSKFEFVYTQTISVDFIFEENKDYSLFIQEINIFLNFISLFMLKMPYVNGMETFYFDNENILMISGALIDIRGYPNSNVLNSDARALLKFEKLRDKLPQLWTNWKIFLENNSAVIRLFSDYRKSETLYLHQSLVTLTQALEVFHRNNSEFESNYIDQKTYEDYVYKPWIDLIPDKTPNELKDALIARMKFGNEYSLRRRLTTIIKEIKTNLPNEYKEKSQDFVNDIVELRNNLTHYGYDSKSHSADKLLELLWFLRTTLTIIILKKIDLDTPLLVELVSNLFDDRPRLIA